MIEGYKWRLERKEEFAAYFTVAVMNMSGRVANPALRMNDLIDPLRDKTVKKKRDREYLMNKFPKLQKARG